MSLLLNISVRQKSFASGSFSLPFFKLVVLGNLSKELPSTQVDFIYRRVELVLLQEGCISSVRNKEISKLKQGKGLFWLCLLIKEELKGERWGGKGDQSLICCLASVCNWFSGSFLGNPLPVPQVSRKSKGRNPGVTDLYGNGINFNQQWVSELQCSREGLTFC